MNKYDITIKKEDKTTVTHRLGAKTIEGAVASAKVKYDGAVIKVEEVVVTKFVLRSRNTFRTVEIDSDCVAERVLEIMQGKEPDSKWTECEIVPDGKHVCKYCGSVAESTFEDLLCAECRQTFGHTLYTEL